jgi:hypothetical protein
VSLHERETFFVETHRLRLPDMVRIVLVEGTVLGLLLLLVLLRLLLLLLVGRIFSRQCFFFYIYLVQKGSKY